MAGTTAVPSTATAAATPAAVAPARPKAAARRVARVTATASEASSRNVCEWCLRRACELAANLGSCAQASYRGKLKRRSLFVHLFAVAENVFYCLTNRKLKLASGKPCLFFFLTDRARARSQLPELYHWIRDMVCGQPAQ